MTGPKIAELAREIFIHHVANDATDFNYQGARERAEMIASQSYQMAEAFATVSKKHKTRGPNT